MKKLIFAICSMLVYLNIFAQERPYVQFNYTLPETFETVYEILGVWVSFFPSDKSFLVLFASKPYFF